VKKQSASWDYRIAERAIKDLRRLGPQASHRVIAFLDEKIRGNLSPRRIGKALRGEHGEFWRYRVGDYRILCRIDGGELIVLVVRIGHRREIYR